MHLTQHGALWTIILLFNYSTKLDQDEHILKSPKGIMSQYISGGTR